MKPITMSAVEIGFPLYRVGVDGSVWSVNWGRWGRAPKWKRLKPFGAGPDRRPMITLCSPQGRRKIYIHHFVLEVFVGPCPEGMEACHEDGNIHNNHLDNLRWDTPKNNAQDKRKHGTVLEGVYHPNSKLSRSDVLQIRSMWSGGQFTGREICRITGIRYHSVYRVINRQRYAST